MFMQHTHVNHMQIDDSVDDSNQWDEVPGWHVGGYIHNALYNIFSISTRNYFLLENYLHFSAAGTG